jgi:hypothetical protein
MVFIGDGKELLKATLAHNPGKTVAQRFKLPEPATFKTLTIKFVSAHEKADGTTQKWGAVAAIGAYDAQGKNVLSADPRSVLRNEKVFTQADAHFYKNAFLALYAKPAMVYYKRILSYDPASKEIGFEVLSPTQAPYEKGGAFSIVNSPRHIDTPGEYALVLDPEADGTHKLFLWPPDGKPENLTRGQHGMGIQVNGSFVTVQGFWVRKQGWSGDTHGNFGAGQRHRRRDPRREGLAPAGQRRRHHLRADQQPAGGEFRGFGQRRPHQGNRAAKRQQRDHPRMPAEAEQLDGFGLLHGEQRRGAGLHGDRESRDACQRPHVLRGLQEHLGGA